MVISEIYNYENGYVGLMINILGLPESINVEGVKLIPKSEFHITLINAAATAQFINTENAESIEAEILEEFKRFITENPIDQYRLFKKFRFVSRDDRKSIIAMAEVPNLQEFFNSLRSSYDKTIPYQPTHATIYVLPNKGGIGLLSDRELERDSKEVEVSELENLKFDRFHN